MGSLKIGGLLLAAAGLALSGCYAPLGTAGSDQAIAMYRRDRARSTAIALHRGGARSSSRRAAPSALTVDQAVTMAMESSPRLAELKALADAATAGADAESHRENPELRITQLRLDQILKGEPRVGTAVRFRPARPGSVDAEVAVATAEEVTALAEARAEELAIEAEIRWLFDDAMLIEAEIAAADAIVAVRRSIVEQTRARLDASRATALDVAMAELSASEAEQASADLRARLGAVRGDLLERVGVDPAAPVRLAGDPAGAWPPADLPSEDALVEAALRNRVEVAAAAAQIDAADAQAFIERSKRWPWFSFVELGYEFSPSTERGLGWTLQAGIELPVFNSGGSATHAAEAAKRAAQSGLAAKVKLVAREVRASLREVQAAAALATELRTRAFPAAERAAAAAAQALEARSIEALEALSAEERRLDVERRFLELVRRYRTAMAELRRAAGGRLPPSGP